MVLSKDDYIKILDYYKVDHKSYDYDKLKKRAEELLATKLCRCIGNVSKKGKNSRNSKHMNKKEKEKRAIAICRSSVLRKKHLRNFGFTCKKRAKFLPKKMAVEI